MTQLQSSLASFIAAIALVGYAPVPAPPRGLTLDADVVRVIDGDTLVLSVSHNVHVRLLDCYSPEVRTLDLEEKARGLAAKAHMSTLVDERRVRIHIPSSGSLGGLLSFDRVLGRVWRLEGEVPEDQSLNSRMVADGFATAEKPPRGTE